MTDGARKVYLGMARLFLLVGGVIASLGMVDLVLGLGVFRGNPVWTSLFLLMIGGLLYWTAVTAERRDDEEPHEATESERTDGS